MINVIRVWVIGDSGTGDANAEKVRDNYYKITGSIHTDVWLMLGDSAYKNGTDEEFQAAVFEMYKKLLKKTVFWPAYGNHDARSASATQQSGTFFEIFTLPVNAEAGGLASGTEAYYSFDYGNIHFVCLDSNDPKNSKMLDWLERDLKATDKIWRIAYWHHPPYSKGSHNSDGTKWPKKWFESDSELRDIREYALPIIEKNGVHLVISGHTHSYQRSYLIKGHYGKSQSFEKSMIKDSSEKGPYNAKNGTVYAIVGSSSKLDAKHRKHPALPIVHHMLGSLVLEVDKNELKARFLGENGIVDNFSIIKATQ